MDSPPSGVKVRLPSGNLGHPLALAELRQRTARFTNDPRFVERVMAMVSERDWGALVSRAARRCIGVCGFIVLLAVWWAMQSRELVPFVYLATESPMESAW